MNCHERRTGTADSDGSCCWNWRTITDTIVDLLSSAVSLITAPIASKSKPRHPAIPLFQQQQLTCHRHDDAVPTRTTITSPTTSRLRLPYSISSWIVVASIGLSAVGSRSRDRSTSSTWWNVGGPVVGLSDSRSTTPRTCRDTVSLRTSSATSRPFHSPTALDHSTVRLLVIPRLPTGIPPSFRVHQWADISFSTDVWVFADWVV